VFCPERNFLTDLFLEATRDLVNLQYAEAEAMAFGAKLERFDLALECAREKKDKIKLAYMLHMQKHGCGEQVVLQAIQSRTDSSRAPKP
jgi:hypothetical protein